MSSTDRDFFIKYHESIKKIIDDFKLKEVSISFDKSIIVGFYAKFMDANVLLDFEDSLKKFCSKCNVCWTVRLCSTIVRGQKITSPEDSIAFDELIKHV